VLFRSSSAVEVDYNVADIADDTGLSWEYTKEVITRLVKAGLVVRTRTIGRSDMFKLAGNKAGKGLLSFIDAFDANLAKQKTKQAQIA
jgi:DNA-binding IscR family transcriptional regulator